MTLIYDIETKTFGKPDPFNDEYRVFGYHDVEKNKSDIIIGDIDKVRKLIKQHKVLIGFNNVGYDNPILERAGVIFNNHIMIDLYQVFKKKHLLMPIKLRRFSLAAIAKELNISQKQDNFDYSILNKNGWTQEDVDLIKEYTLQDIKVTYEMWKHVDEFFKPFAGFLNKYDQAHYKHLTTTSGSYAYKVICNELGIAEEYNDRAGHEKYDGGYVLEPSTEFITGNLYCFDFNSMYPHAYIQANLFSNNCKCCLDSEKYTGGDLFDLQGAYCTKHLGKVEQVIRKFYNKRLEYKKNNDSREYAIKIIINTMYGICGNPVFKNLYNINTASDCALIARECVKLAKKMFKDNGYNIIYGDTDSIYLEDVFNDESKMMDIKNIIVSKIKSSLPFPQDTFDMGIDERIRLMFVPNLKKKNYIYVTTDNNLVIKGLPFKKSNASPLSMVVFKKYIKKNIIYFDTVKFDKKVIKQWVMDELENNIELAALEFKVFAKDVYKNPSQLQAQISERYGRGIHTLIPNLCKVGAGKGKGYCTIEEFKKEGLLLYNIDLSKTYSELNIFCKESLNNKKMKMMEKPINALRG